MDKSNVHVQVICDYCGASFSKPYQAYRVVERNKQKIACQKCSGEKINEATILRRRLSHYSKIQEWCDKNEYVLISNESDIANVQSDIYYICPKHGKQRTKVTNILQGKACYACGRTAAGNAKANSTLRDRQEAHIDGIMSVADQKGYEIIGDLSEIKRNTDYITYLCPIHGKQRMRVSNFKIGKGCPGCAKDKASKQFSLSIDEVENRITQLGGLLLNKSEYINQYRKNLRILCNRCGGVFITSLVLFVQHGGQVCPECSHIESNGERKIRNHLMNMNIPYVQEKIFQDCRDIRPLPFDFYLPSQNMCIEFDGEQHFMDKGKFGNTLSYIQAHDQIKTNYCHKHKIELIRFPYWEYNNIETIINHHLHKDIV